MSYTEIFAFRESGHIDSIAEIRNGNRSGAAIWAVLEERYLPKLRYPRMILGMTAGDGEDPMQELWDLWKRDDVTITDKIVLLSTFDGAVCAKEHLPRLIAAFRAFGGETSLPEQAEAILAVQDDADLWGIGWNQTSVNGDDWTNAGGYDEEKEEAIPYDFNTGDKHFGLFSFERPEAETA